MNEFAIAFTIIFILFIIGQYFVQKYLWHYGYCTICGGEFLFVRRTIMGNKYKCSDICKNEKTFAFNFKKGLED